MFILALSPSGWHILTALPCGGDEREKSEKKTVFCTIRQFNLAFTIWSSLNKVCTKKPKRFNDLNPVTIHSLE